MQNCFHHGGLREKHLHEGLIFVCLSPILNRDFLEELNIKPLHRDEPLDATNDNEASWFDGIRDYFFQSMDTKNQNHLYMERVRAIDGAQFLFVAAALTAAITKLIYFNSLFSYSRAMQIFIKMERNGDLFENPASQEENNDYDYNSEPERPEYSSL